MYRETYIYYDTLKVSVSIKSFLLTIRHAYLATPFLQSFLSFSINYILRFKYDKHIVKKSSVNKKTFFILKWPFKRKEKCSSL